MDASENVLSGMHFAIAKSDKQLGYIRSRPLRGGQWFEFWRKDNVGADNLTESNLHTVRRIVELNIEPQEDRLCINCTVKVQRLSVYDSQADTASRDYAILPRQNLLLKDKAFKSKQKTWIDVGDDEKLTALILSKIEANLKSF